MSVKTVALGADHNGVSLKKILVEHLQCRGFTCIDVGSSTSSSPVDYPDYATQVAKLVALQKADVGILICGTGIGMSIVANRLPNVRAALVHNMLSAKKSREHNDSNVLCLGSWIHDDATNIAFVDTWLSEPFGQGRHCQRLIKIEHCCSLP